MQYYSKLCGQLSLMDADNLCDLFYAVELTTVHEMTLTLILQLHSISEKYVPELILTRLASCLLSGKTHLFYKMLKILKEHRDVSIRTITVEIQVALHRRLIGM